VYVSKYVGVVGLSFLMYAIRKRGKLFGILILRNDALICKYMKPVNGLINTVKSVFFVKLVLKRIVSKK
jgi:hypothetical protein